MEHSSYTIMVLFCGACFQLCTTSERGPWLGIGAMRFHDVVKGTKMIDHHFKPGVFIKVMVGKHHRDEGLVKKTTIQRG